MIARIIVTPKRSVLDPQGEAVRRAIHSLGMDCVASTRVGRYIELEITGQNIALTRTKLDEICQDLLSNPVVEDYKLELDLPGSKAKVIDFEEEDDDDKKSKKKKKKKKDKEEKRLDKKRKDKIKSKKLKKKK